MTCETDDWTKVGTFPEDKYDVRWNGNGWDVYVQKGNEAFS